MHFCVVHRARGSVAFQLVRSDGVIALTGAQQGDVDACVRAISELVTSLREGVGAVRHAKSGQHRFALTGEQGAVLGETSACATEAEADAALAELRRWAAGEPRFRIKFPPEQRVSHAAHADIGVAVRYDLEQESSSGRSGVELLRRAGDNFYCAHFNDEAGRALLYLRGFPTRYPRDERVRALVQAMGDVRRYRVEDGDGRVYFVVTARNGRELARSRWFAARGECEAAVAWLVGVAPGAAEALDGRAARRTVVSSYQLERPSATGAPGFELFRGADRRHYFHLNGPDGAGLVYSHGYGTKTERDAGMRALIRVAMARDHYRVRTDEAGCHFVILAGNSRELARSRDFVAADEAERAILWTLQEITVHGTNAGVRRRETLFVAVPSGGPDRFAGLGLPEPTTPAVTSGARVADASASDGDAVVATPRAEDPGVTRAPVSEAPAAASAKASAAGSASAAPEERASVLPAAAVAPAPRAVSKTAVTARSATIPRQVEALLAELRSERPSPTIVVAPIQPATPEPKPAVVQAQRPSGAPQPPPETVEPKPAVVVQARRSSGPQPLPETVEPRPAVVQARSSGSAPQSPREPSGPRPAIVVARTQRPSSASQSPREPSEPRPAIVVTRSQRPSSAPLAGAQDLRALVAAAMRPPAPVSQPVTAAVPRSQAPTSPSPSVLREVRAPDAAASRPRARESASIATSSEPAAPRARDEPSTQPVDAPAPASPLAAVIVRTRARTADLPPTHPVDAPPAATAGEEPSTLVGAPRDPPVAPLAVVVEKRSRRPVDAPRDPRATPPAVVVEKRSSRPVEAPRGPAASALEVDAPSRARAPERPTRRAVDPRGPAVTEFAGVVDATSQPRAAATPSRRPVELPRGPSVIVTGGMLVLSRTPPPTDPASAPTAAIPDLLPADVAPPAASPTVPGDPPPPTSPRGDLALQWALLALLGTTALVIVVLLAWR